MCQDWLVLASKKTFYTKGDLPVKGMQPTRDRAADIAHSSSKSRSLAAVKSAMKSVRAAEDIVN